MAALAVTVACALCLLHTCTVHAADAILRELRVNNQCKIPVILHEAGHRVVHPGETVSFANDVVDMSDSRISLSYEHNYVNENLAILELNGMFKHIGRRGRKMNLNFVAQWGFIDLPMEVSLWANKERTKLACEDGRARCNFRAEDCRHIKDGSAEYLARSAGGRRYGYCRSRFTLTDMRTCVGDYAKYVNDHCFLFSRRDGRWTHQSRSVGVSTWGWQNSIFSDGMRRSTRNGREHLGRAVTYECWEQPCVSRKHACALKGYTAVGNAGFAANCDVVNGLVDVAVMEITACPVRQAPFALFQSTTAQLGQQNMSMAL